MIEKVTAAGEAAALIELRKKYSGNSTKIQCVRLHEALKLFPVNTHEARLYLDLYWPPARVLQLRQSGLKIITRWLTVETEARVKHRVGQYVLLPGGAE